MGIHYTAKDFEACFEEFPELGLAVTQVFSDKYDALKESNPNAD